MSRGIEIRQVFIRSVIRVVAAQGIQNATTKALSADSGLSEVYIYRYFNNKDDLLKQAFDSLDMELMLVMKKTLENNVAAKDNNASIGFESIFHDFWKFSLGDRDKCSFFIQYYYSSYYALHSESERKNIYKPLLDAIAPFYPEEDPWIQLNHIYDVAFPKILRVIRGSIPDTPETEQSVYRELFLSKENDMS